MRTFYRFDHVETPPLEEVGGKAQSLIQTTRAGFPVPDGRVLTVEFFTPWIRAIQATEPWRAFLQAIDLADAQGNDVSQVKPTCDAVKEACEALSLSDSQRADLNAALDGFSPDEIFAVRSSSPAGTRLLAR